MQRKLIFTISNSTILHTVSQCGPKKRKVTY